MESSQIILEINILKNQKKILRKTLLGNSLFHFHCMRYNSCQFYSHPSGKAPYIYHQPNKRPLSILQKVLTVWFNLRPGQAKRVLLCGFCFVCSFLMWTIFKICIELVKISLLFYVFIFWPWGMWLPDQGLNLHTLHWEEEVLTTGSPGKTLKLLFLPAVFFCFVSILFHIKLHLFISYVDSVPHILTIRLIVILAKNYRKLHTF